MLLYYIILSVIAIALSFHWYRMYRNIKRDCANPAAKLFTKSMFSYIHNHPDKRFLDSSEECGQRLEEGYFIFYEIEEGYCALSMVNDSFFVSFYEQTFSNAPVTYVKDSYDPGMYEYLVEKGTRLYYIPNLIAKI